MTKPRPPDVNWSRQDFWLAILEKTATVLAMKTVRDQTNDDILVLPVVSKPNSRPAP